MADLGYKVFVYGTLKPGGHYWPRFCEGKVSAQEPAQINGRLYDLHVGYPAMSLQGTGWVQGYVLTFPREADFLQLDVLEGYDSKRDPAENEYWRLKVHCYSPEGCPLGEVWAYEMAVERIAQMGGTLLADGNWQV